MEPALDPLLRKGGSEDPDPLFPNVDPRQNEMDPKRCFQHSLPCLGCHEFPLIDLSLGPSQLSHVQG